MHNFRLYGKLLFFILVLSFISSFVLLLASPGTTADGDFPLFFIIDDTPGIPGGDSTFIFTDHTSNLASGNWIQLSGGTQHDIPNTSVNVDYPLDITTTISGNDLTIDTYYSTRQFDYPLSSHSTYIQGQTVTANFYGSNNIAGDSGLDWRLITASEAQLDSAFTSSMDGDASDLVTLLSSGNAIWEEAESNLDGSGNAATTFTAPTAGTYYLFLVAETSSPYKIVIYGCTMVEVLEYTLSATSPSIVTRGAFISPTITITNPPGSTNGFTYGALIINDNSYELDVDIIFDSTISGSSVSVNSESIIEGSRTLGSAELIFPGITSLSTLDTDEMTQKLSNMFISGNIAIGFSAETTQNSAILSISTSGLNTGLYNLLMGVWEDGALVGFDTSTVTIRAPSGGGGGGGGGPTKLPLPEPWAVDIMSPEDAYDRLSPYSPTEIAGVLDEVEPRHVLEILSLFEQELMYDILNEMSLDSVSQILDTMNPALITTMLNNLEFDKATLLLAMSPDSAGKVLNQLDPEEAANIILSLSVDDILIIDTMIQDDINKAALQIEAAIKQIIEELDEVTKEILLDALTGALESLSAESLVDLFIEIAGLPETPSSVALILDNMKPDIITGIIETWTSRETLEPLANICEYLSLPTLDQVYRDLGNDGRISIYPFFTFSILSKLPVLSTTLVADLFITPGEVEEGEMVKISYTIENQGELSDDYEIVTTIDDTIEATNRDMLAPGEKVEITLLVNRAEAGTYNVEVAGLSGTFTVLPPTVIIPATFVIDKIEVTPEEVEKGMSVNVFVTISNIGDEKGTQSFELLVDSEAIEIKEATVSAHSQATLLFEIEMNYDAGEHEIRIGESSSTINITEPSFRLPWITLLAITIIVTAIVLYVLREREII
jgi:methanogen extracellular protein (TIGR04279 family)